MGETFAYKLLKIQLIRSTSSPRIKKAMANKLTLLSGETHLTQKVLQLSFQVAVVQIQNPLSPEYLDTTEGTISK